MKYIDLPVPHGFLIWRGKQTAIAMPQSIPADKLLIVSNGEAYGEVILSQPIAVNTKEFNRHIEAHCIKEYERRLWWPDAEAFYIHQIKEFKGFEQPILFENGEMVDYRPSEQEQAFINQAVDLPKMLVIDDSAVVMSGDGQHLISDKIKDFGDIARILEAGVKADGSDNVLPIYSLALVRNPRLVVKKKENQVAYKNFNGGMIALWLPEDKANELVQDLPEATKPNDMHITLVYLGKADEIDQETKDTVENVIQDVALNSMPVNGKVGGLIRFTGNEGDGTNAVCAQFDSQGINTLREEIVKELEIAGIKLPSEHGFTPHITLGYVPADSNTPTIDLPNTEIEFSELSVSWGDDRKLFSFGSKQEATMPYAIAEEGFGDCEQIAVVKVDDEMVMGCHETMEEAEAQVTALNIAEAEEVMDEEEKEEDDFDQRVIASLQSQLSKDNKSGKRLNSGMLNRLKDAWATIKELLSWAEYTGEDKSFGIEIKEIDGEPWHFMWSTNAFRDREKEIFSTKSLDNFANEVNEKEKKGFFNFWHIPGTDFAEKRFIETAGRFLIEAGPYLKDAKGKAALKFFKKYKDGHPDFAPEGWGGSPEYRFNPEDRDDGVYDWLWIDRTSTLPRAAAANIYTQSGQQEVKMSTLDGQRKEAAIALFGNDFVDNLLKDGEKRTATLEEAGVAHKNKSEELDIKAVIKEALAEQVEVDLGAITEVVTQLGETVKAQAAEIASLKKEKQLKVDAETPRYVLQLQKRASDAKETELADDDPLKGKKPVETSADKSLAGAYFGR